MDDRDERLTATLGRAWRIVEGADLPEALRERAFGRTLELLLSRDPDAAPRDSGGGPSLDGGTTTAGAAADASGPADAIARRAGVDERAIRDVYRIENDAVALVVGERKLDRNNATGSRQITLLVAGGRQAAGLEEWTKLAQARDACEVYGRLDSKNYAATIKSMAQAFNFHGRGVQREVRLTMRGWQEWADLVRRLVA